MQVPATTSITKSSVVGPTLGSTNTYVPSGYWWPQPNNTYIYPYVVKSQGSDTDSTKLAISVIKRLLTKEALEQFSDEERDELKLALAVLNKE